MKVVIMDYDKRVELRIAGETEFEKQFLAGIEVINCKKTTMIDGKEKQIIVEAKRGE